MQEGTGGAIKPGSKRILLTGGGGMLAATLVPHLIELGHQVFSFDREHFDITDLAAVQEHFDEVKPHLVMHCAAYTAVDQAESDSNLSFAVNATGTENIAKCCAAANVKGSDEIPMVYISTDYVFDGKSNVPYKPYDRTAPESKYGMSKLAGEQAVQKHLKNYYIVRTSWLYGPGGKNFVDTIYKLASEKPVIKVVADQKGSPTSTKTLSRILGALIESGKPGIYHATDMGEISWYDFACQIASGLPCKVEPCTTQEMPRPAPRPAYSALDKTSLIETVGFVPPTWQEALAEYMELVHQVKKPEEAALV